MIFPIPPRVRIALKSATFPEGRLDECCKQIFNNNESFFFFGPNGMGKTIAAAAIVNHAQTKWLENPEEWTMEFIPVVELLDALRPNSTYHKMGDLMWRLRASTDLLVLDDLGVEKLTEWTYERLYLLINHRYLQMKPTIITSNLSLEALSDYWQDFRITRRINEMCLQKEIKNQGDL